MVVFQWIQAHYAELGTGLFFLSEALALIPVVKANSVFQLAFGWLARFKPKT